MPVEMENLSQAEIAFGVVMLIAGAASALGLIRAIITGHLRESVLASGPRRAGELNVIDMVITVCLFIGLPTFCVLTARQFGIGDGPRGLVMLMAAVQVGMLMVVVFVLGRAAMAMEGGLAAFGFAWKRFRASLPLTLAASAIVIPFSIVVVGILVRLIGQAIGHPPPDIAHGALQAIADGPWPVKVALAISAVLVAPVLEEIIFRGMLQTALNQTVDRMAASRPFREIDEPPPLPGAGGRPLSRWAVIVLVAVVFAAVHVDWAGGAPETPTPTAPAAASAQVADGASDMNQMPAGSNGEAGRADAADAAGAREEGGGGGGVPIHAFFVLLPLSIGFGYLYERTGSLLACMLMHGLFNAVNVGMVLAGMG